MISTINDQLSAMTSEVLRDLGRNEGADRSWRKAAVKMLMEKNHPYANHPDFRELRLEIKEEENARHEVESLVAQVQETVQKVDNPDPEDENFIHEPDEAVGPEARPGPFKAGFTTKSMT